MVLCPKLVIVYIKEERPVMIKGAVQTSVCHSREGKPTVTKEMALDTSKSKWRSVGEIARRTALV